MRWASLLWVLLAAPAHGQDLRLPSTANLTAEVQDEAGLTLPTGPWQEGEIPTVQIDGTVTSRSWRIDAAGLTSEQVMRNLREQITNNQFDILLDCQTDDCGGFDFRFAIDVIRPPKMQINLADFRVLTARKDDLGLMLIASKTRDAGYLQITFVGDSLDPQPESGPAALATPTAGFAPARTLAEQLNQTGRAVLADLAFERGSARLEQGLFDSLQDLASYLAANPSLKVALVGHTDAEGSLDGNIALSKRRAGSVLERLVSDYAIQRSRLAAEGMGYLAPVANNLTAEGREANRRVEVIITSVSE